MVKDNRFESWATSHGYEFDYSKKDFVAKDGTSLSERESELRLRSRGGEIPEDSPDYRATDRDMSFDAVKGKFVDALSEAYDAGADYVKKVDTKKEFETFSSREAIDKVTSKLDAEGKKGLTGFVEPAFEKRVDEITTKGEEIFAKVEKMRTQSDADSITREINNIPDPEVRDSVKRIVGIGGGDSTVIVKTPTTTIIIAPKDTGKVSSAWASGLRRIDRVEAMRQKVLEIPTKSKEVQDAFKVQLNRGRTHTSTQFAKDNELSLAEAENLLVSLGYQIVVTGKSKQRRFKPY